MKSLITIIILLGLSGFIHAQTIIPGGTINGDTWNKAGSPYIIQDDVTIEYLIIDPGVTVEFDGDHKFDINNFLHASGFYSDSIFFKPSASNGIGWQGIKFKNGSAPNNVLRYCRIERTTNPAIQVDNSLPTIENCRVVNTDNNGFYVKNTSLQIKNCLIRYNLSNGIELDAATITAINTIIADNDESGILTTNNLDSIFVVNSVIADNQSGIDAGSRYFNIINSIIYDNFAGIISTNPASSATYSNIQGGSLYPGMGNINSPPSFTDSLPYYLQNSSLCIDAGDPDTSYNDAFFPPSKGGIRNDMGAYGGPAANGWFPPLYLRPQNIDFVRVSRDSTASFRLDIINYRYTGKTVTDITPVGNNPGVFSTDKSNFYLPPRDTTDLMVSFTPPSDTLYSAQLVLQTLLEGTVTIPLAGEGVLPEINLLQSSLDFEQVLLADSSELYLSIMNSGRDTLRLSFLPPGSPVFSMNEFTLTIAPDSSLDSVRIICIPDSPITYQDSLIIFSNDPENLRLAIPIAAEGFGPVISFDRETLDFGTIQVLRDTLLLLSILNEGNDTLFIENFTVIQPDSEHTVFQIIDSSFSLPAEILPDSLYQITLRFQPAIQGQVNGQLIVQSDDPFNDQAVIPLQGSGITPEINISSNELQFGQVLLFSDSLQILKVYNTGSDQLIVYKDSLKISGPDSLAFQFNSLVSDIILNPGDTAEFVITFTPHRAGNFEAEMEIISNDPLQHEISVDLYGTGIAPGINLSTTELQFGQVLLFSDSLKLLKVYNTGSDQLIVYKDSLKISGPDSLAFRFNSLVSDIILNSGDSAGLVITFTPHRTGDFEAVMEIISNDPLQHVISVDLYGSGIVPTIALSSSQLSFGQVPVSGDSLKLLTVYNTGEAKLLIYQDSLTVRGPDSTSFVIENISGDINIDAGDSANIDIRFIPADYGEHFGELNLRCNDPFNPILLVDLSGLGVDDLPASISFDLAQSTQPLIKDQEARLSFNITSQSPVDSSLLFIRQGGQGGFIQYTLNRQTPSRWNAVIDSFQVTERGIEYYVKVRHGYRTTFFPETAMLRPNALQVSIPEMDFPQPSQASRYQMISIPFSTNGQDLHDLFFDNLGPYDPTRYRIFDYSSGAYIELELLDSPLPPGKALWLITMEPVQLDVSNGLSVLTDQNFSLQLNEGWNMIATPFAFKVAWNQISNVHVLWYYDGIDWQVATTLEPFKGYAVYSANDTLLSVPPREAATTGILSKNNGVENESGWSIQISINQENLKDEFNYAGVLAHANANIDRHDYPEPPRIGDYVQLFFNCDNQSIPYARDFRAPGEEGYAFSFEMRGNVQGNKEISFNPQNIPDKFDWAVVNPETKINHGNNSIYTSASRADYVLLVGTVDYLSDAVKAYAQVPLDFRVEQNYPNPFNPNTLIKFQIPQRGRVTVNIFNILGQLIKTLYEDRPLEAGYYTIEWNGTNEVNQPVSSGIYFLQLRTINDRRVIKMILQR